MSAHTPGPWHTDSTVDGLAIESASHGNIGLVNLARASKADARLIAAAPDLVDGCNALLGLIQLVCARKDMPLDIKRALESSHRVDEARAALAKAGVS
jgi:hypothetical protein